MSTSYSRVIPRDLFNESKVLKCFGQLALIIHDEVGVRWPLKIEHDDPDAGFVIGQNDHDGALYVDTLRVMVGETTIPAVVRYNSRAPYPIYFDDETTGETVDLLNDDGTLSDEFSAWLDAQKGQQ